MHKQTFGYSGKGMDRVYRSKPSLNTYLLYFGVFVLCLGMFYALSSDGLQMSTSISKVSVGKVTRGVFSEYIPLRTTIAPQTSVRLDAVQAGRVDGVFFENGDRVRKGEMIVKLSNSDLELNVMGIETRVLEQLGFIKEHKLRIQENALKREQELLELEYRILKMEQERKENDILMEKSLISEREYNSFLIDLQHVKKRYKNALESDSVTRKLVMQQSEFFQEKSLKMEKNLEVAKKSLDELYIRTPISGILSEFQVDVGKRLAKGEALGIVSNPNSLKCVGYIDEYYLGKLDLSATAVVERNKKIYTATLSKIYPNVQNRQFQVDLLLTDPPENLRIGESLHFKLILSNKKNALIIPNGQFFSDTGGQWIYVLNKDKTFAEKRFIQLGKRSTDALEVLAGLNEHEEVITSSYISYKRAEKLVFR